ncbi:hypothetical protein [Rhizobium sp. Root1220]|uniref:hypothetical protein n=1 Tax=Rhizobium sp. Root1220 TaxID=1736432 RepID=UPI0006F98E1D|nr:hypothetical protein [Rhizobium sp. Root1220]KQV81867.1 hypothetical protein ASC90_24760 [Rhizobium sp. Root1220]
MTKHFENATAETATRVWEVTTFCKDHRIEKDEEAQLRRLFGAFATESELFHNTQRSPRWRD